MLAASAQTKPAEFTPVEQQSISVETPGLFERTKAFTVDFGQMKADEYSFPLPVGKVEGDSRNMLTIVSSKGDAVKAMFGGTVRLSHHTQQQGNVIVVRHSNGLETVYANNAQNLVKVGDKVRAGQTIAIIGTKGDRTYCDFAIMVNGARVNPETIIDINSHRLRKQMLLFEKQGFGVSIKVVYQEQEVTRNKRGKIVKVTPVQTDTEKAKGSKTISAKKAKELTTPDKVDNPFDGNGPIDIDEYQALKVENAKNPFAKSNEFTINFAAYSAAEWCYPLPGAHVISPFGGKRRHSGTDIKTKANDDIHAAFDGQVVLSGVHYGYGNCIILRHANGLETLYSHNSKNLVKVGEWVKAGQVIAKVGRTGRATTEHLHFEVRVNGRPFDSGKLYDHQKNTLRPELFVFRKSGKGVTISTSK